MKRVKLSDAKNNLSRYVDQVRRGERVRIMLRDEPVADLVPIGAVEQPASSADDALMADLLSRGVARVADPSASLPKELLRPGPRLRGARAKTRAVDVLTEERRSGR